ncbi:MAG TPA: hypothetical protein VMP01_04010 [Pirellulaceae bacterium]|nr:hypothetical protein [Pirellulaceae bacterium]
MRALILTMLLGGLAAANADDPQTLSARLLDDSRPAQERQSLIEKHPDLAAELVAAMTASLPANDPKEEYRRIPWIWRVAVAAGKRNDEKSLRGLLDVSLPRPGETLRDWQAVVIGGGVINGISLAGKWPHERIGDLLHGDEGLQKRWKQALSAAATMADDEQVKKGTRYDALRMIALDPTKESREHLTKYLAEGTDAELQMGAVSGLSDIDAQEIAPLLIGHVQHMTPSNRTLAIDALLRSDARAKALLGAIESGTIAEDWLSPQQKQALRSQPQSKR